MNEKTTPTIACVGGGTGGHIYPVLNLIKYAQQNNVSANFIWIGERNSLEEKICKKENIAFYPVSAGKLRRHFSLKTLWAPVKVLSGVFEARRILKKNNVSAVFSKGGYVSLPVCVAAKRLNIPISLHESDSIPGMANKMVAKYADNIFVSFKKAKKYFDKEKVVGVGHLLNPNMGSYNDGKKISSSSIGKPPRLLVSCGSQGASRIFDELYDHRFAMTFFDVHLILGTQNTNYQEKFEKLKNFTVYEFFQDQDEYLDLVASCDLVITRGSSSIFEFEVFGLQMVIIPLPESGNNHQLFNAQAFEKKGHDCIEQSDLSEKIIPTLEKYKHFHKTAAKPKIDLKIYDKILKSLLK